MKPTFNWGFWIVVSFILFAAGKFTMVYIAMSTHVDLVTDNYYEKELKYQQHIDLVKNTNSLERNVEMEASVSAVTIRYPKMDGDAPCTGTIYFYRPSDMRGDIVREVAPDSNRLQTFPAGLFAKGLWRAKISWNAGDQRYYSEIPFIIR